MLEASLMGEIRYFIVDGNYQMENYVDDSRANNSTIIIESRGGLFCYRNGGFIFRRTPRLNNFISAHITYDKRVYYIPDKMPDFISDFSKDSRNKPIINWILFHTDLFLGKTR